MRALIPHISFIELDVVLAQQLAIFLLKSAHSMVLFLSLKVF